MVTATVRLPLPQPLRQVGWQHVTLALGPALALFLYPHSITGVLASRGRDVIKRNMSVLPAYSLPLGLIALLGYMAIAANVKPLPGAKACALSKAADRVDGTVADDHFADERDPRVGPPTVDELAGVGARREDKEGHLPHGMWP